MAFDDKKYTTSAPPDVPEAARIEIGGLIRVKTDHLLHSKSEIVFGLFDTESDFSGKCMTFWFILGSSANQIRNYEYNHSFSHDMIPDDANEHLANQTKHQSIKW